MCLIALAYRLHPRYSLVLVGNRDEFHVRPSLPLGPWLDAPGLVGGRDVQAGGAWLALTPDGRLGAVTNVRLPVAASAEAASRGALIPEFLHSGLAADRAAEQLLATAKRHGPFNLLLFDGQTLAYASNQPAPRWLRLAAGKIYGLSNATLDTPWPKTTRLTAALEHWLTNGSEDVEPLFAALADESPVPDAQLPSTGVALEWERQLATPFIRGPGYGTRASSVVLLGNDGSLSFEERRWGPAGAALGTTRWTHRP